MRAHGVSIDLLTGVVGARRDCVQVGAIPPHRGRVIERGRFSGGLA